jgi:hypothetical protein
MNRWWLAAAAPVLVFLAMGPLGGAAEKDRSAKEAAGKEETGKTLAAIEKAVFPMEEVPAFGKEEVDGKPRYYYPSGTYMMCNTVPSKEVKAYPELKSKRPLYGSVTFDRDGLDPKGRRTFHFVLDESGVKKPAAVEKETEKGSNKDTEKKSKQAATEKTVATKQRAGFDGLRPETWKYDLLYFDCNGDLDLTNDGVVKLAEKSPFEDLPAAMGAGFFEEVKVTLDFGAGAGQRPVVLLPKVHFLGPDSAMMQFLPKTARKGKIRLGDEEYVARLCQPQIVSGRYDRPQVQLELVAADASKGLPPMQGPLSQMRWVAGQFVSFSATPLGDKLAVDPYHGETGMLEVGPGGRAITDLGIAGQLTSRAGITIALGENLPQAPGGMLRRYPLPVGDYAMPFFTARHGRLRFSGRMTPDVDREAGKRDPYPIRIRKESTFVLEFSGKPEVKFMSPSKDHSFKPGDNIRVAAMLTEPWQGIQIMGLWGASNDRLDPSIAVRNAAGDVVAEGKMPFG